MRNLFLLLFTIFSIWSCTKEVEVEVIREVKVEDTTRINQLQEQVNDLLSMNGELDNRLDEILEAVDRLDMSLEEAEDRIEGLQIKSKYPVFNLKSEEIRRLYNYGDKINIEGVEFWITHVGLHSDAGLPVKRNGEWVSDDPIHRQGNPCGYLSEDLDDSVQHRWSEYFNMWWMNDDSCQNTTRDFGRFRLLTEDDSFTISIKFGQNNSIASIQLYGNKVEDPSHLIWNASRGGQHRETDSYAYYWFELEELDEIAYKELIQELNNRN